MNLDQTQKDKIAGWLEEGLKLGEIQSKIFSELGVQMTYMELRFLLDDLKLKPKEKEVPPPAPAADLEKAGTSAKPSQPQPSGAPTPDDLAEDEGFIGDEALPPGAGNVSVTVDRLARPGALVSGNVTFSDGNSAQWYLDQTGRLGLVPKQQGYRPSQPDLLNFQAQLQSELAKVGY
jgi:hypothetical protein